MPITTAQIRAARGLLNWSQSELAERTGISSTSIGSIENGNSHPREGTLETIRIALEQGGVEFTNDGGVVPQRNQVHLYTGTEDFKRFMDDVYETAKTVGGDICIFNTMPEYWLKLLGEEWCQQHYERMMKAKENFIFRAITKQQNDLLLGQGFIDYRWIPSEIFNDKTFYCYGNKLAFLDFKKNDVQVWVLEHAGFANGFRTLFQISWDHVAIKPKIDPQKDILVKTRK